MNMGEFIITDATAKIGLANFCVNRVCIGELKNSILH